MADPAVPPIVSLSYDEPEQMADVMALHDLDVLVLSRATRAWQHVSVRLGPLTLDWGYTPARILARGAAGRAACFNFATASRDEAMLWNGHLVGRNEFIGSSAGAEFAATTGVSTHVALFAAPDTWSMWLTPLLGVEHWTIDSGCSLFRAEPQAMERLRRIVQVALSVCESVPELLRHDEARLGMADSLVGALAGAVASARVGSPRPDAMQSHAHIIRRAEEFIRARVDLPIYIVELCNATNVSERTLRTAFHDIYRTSPTRYLKIRRLHQVRRALRCADPARSTVTEVAGQYGFWELGRFAGHYKALFGETPSQTLHGASGGCRPM